MALALYRKYRPSTFSQLVGQEVIKSTLSNALLQNKITNSYIFVGPRGTGKTSTARLMAKGLNCEAGVNPDPCDACDSCLSITKGSSLDVIEVDAASHTGIDNIRDLILSSKIPPIRARFKVFIIDEVHMLSNAAFNALLKTLEEPSQKTIFILATTEVHKVLPTILSRCQRYQFENIDEAIMLSHLKNVSDKENITYDPQALQVIVNKANGGLRDGLTLLEQAAVFGDGNVSIQVVAGMFGSYDDELMLRVSDAIVKKDPMILELKKSLYLKYSDPHRIVTLLLEHIKNLAIVSLNKAVPAFLTIFNHKDKYKEQAAAMAPAQWFNLLDYLSREEYRIRYVDNPNLFLDIILLNLLRMDESQVSVALGGAAQGSAINQKATAPAAASKPQAPAVVTADIPKFGDLKATQQQQVAAPQQQAGSLTGGQWEKFAEDVLAKKYRMAYIILKGNATCDRFDIDGGNINLLFRDATQRAGFESRNKQQVQDALRSAYNKEFNITSGMGAPSAGGGKETVPAPATPKTPQGAPGTAAAEVSEMKQSGSKGPVTDMLMDIFPGAKKVISETNSRGATDDE